MSIKNETENDIAEKDRRMIRLEIPAWVGMSSHDVGSLLKFAANGILHDESFDIEDDIVHTGIVESEDGNDIAFPFDLFFLREEDRTMYKVIISGTQGK